MTGTTDYSGIVSFESFVERCTPDKWTIRVAGQDPHNAHISSALPMPADKNISNALALAGYPPGNYEIQPLGKTRGAAMGKERSLIQLGPRRRVPSGMVTLTDAHAGAPVEPRTPVGPGEARVTKERAAAEEARWRRERLQEEAESARLEREIRQMRDADLPLEDDTDQTHQALLEMLNQRDPAPTHQQQQGTDMAPLFVAMMNSQQQAAARSERVLVQLLENMRTENAESRKQSQVGSNQLLEGLTLIEKMREVFGADGGGGGEDANSLVGMFKAAAQAFASRTPAAQPQLAPQAGPVPMPQQPGQVIPMPAPPAPVPSATVPQPVPEPQPQPVATEDVGRTRTRQLFGVLLQEHANGTKPEAVADSEEVLDAIELLPEPLRVAFEENDFSNALTTAVEYVPELTQGDWDSLLGWFQSFAARAAENLKPMDVEGEDDDAAEEA